MIKNSSEKRVWLTGIDNKYQTTGFFEFSTLISQNLFVGDLGSANIPFGATPAVQGEPDLSIASTN